MIVSRYLTAALTRIAGALVLAALLAAGLPATVSGAYAATLAPSAGRVVHDFPYSWTPQVRTPASGKTGDLVTMHGVMCRGATSWVRILAMSGTGGYETRPGTVRGDHVSFRLAFGRGDRGRWVIEGVTAQCADGSAGVYGGPGAVHPVIRVN
jgi:hypothetical protein